MYQCSVVLCQSCSMSSTGYQKIRVFECFPFFNELDILEIHLNVLAPLVDYFVIVEATRNFMGREKPLYFQENRDRFAAFSDKIIHVIVDDLPSELDAASEPEEIRATGFKREALQRSAMNRGLREARPDDLIIVSDVDEIIKPDVFEKALADYKDKITYFEGVYYHYFLNWRLAGHEDLKTTRMIEMKYFKDGHHLRKTKGRRSKSLPEWLEYFVWLPYAARRHGHPLGRQIMHEGCWHLSFMMNSDKIRKKLQAYSHTERTTDDFLAEGKIEERIARRISVFGTSIEVDPIETLPAYVRENIDRYRAIVDFGDAPPCRSHLDQ